MKFSRRKKFHYISHNLRGMNPPAREGFNHIFFSLIFFLFCQGINPSAREGAIIIFPFLIFFLCGVNAPGKRESQSYNFSP